MKLNQLILNVPNGITKLDGGNYNIDTIINAIQTVTTWSLRIGIALSGVALIFCFIIYSTADIDQKARVKQRIIQTLYGVIGIILSLSLVNLIIDLFSQ